MKNFETQLYSGGEKNFKLQDFPRKQNSNEKTGFRRVPFYKQCGLLTLNCDQTHLIEGTEAFKVTPQDYRLPETIALMIEPVHWVLNSVLSFRTPNCLWVWLFDEIYLPLSFRYWQGKKREQKKPTTCFNCAEENKETTGNFNCPWVQNREVVAGELGAWGPRQGK